MEDKISLKESQRQWHVLLQRQKNDSGRIGMLRMTAPRRRQPHSDKTTTTTTTESNTHQEAEDDDDPFDCSDLRVPSVAGLVDETAALYVREWKELDERKIVGILADMNENNNNNSNINKERATAAASRKRPYWLDKHVRLPEHFDYATVQDGPPPSHAGDDDDNDSTMNGDDRVLSLQDPTKTTSYHAELWKLFAAIPTAKQLEQDAIAGMRLPHSTKLRNEMAKEGVSNNKSRDELYGLSRLRMSDRHCFPSSLSSGSVPAAPSGTSSSTNQAVKLSDQAVLAQSPPPPAVGSIVFECWKRQLKRGCMPDPSRAVLEFLGSQTLYDVHCALVDLTEDEFWKQVVLPSDTADDSSTQTKESEEESSGMFFIENIFYTTGSVDYVTPIQDWLLLQGKKPQHESSRRALGLGINHNGGGKKLPVRSMKKTRLDEIEMRLGVRYLHVHHGNVECAVFLVDRQYSCTAVDTATTVSSLSSLTAATAATAIATSPFPLLHDVWTPTFATPDCEACSTAAPHSGRGRPAVMATATTCAVTDGHRALCLDCARQLALSIHRTNASSTTSGKNKKQKLFLQPYSVWRGQADMAMDACGDKNF